MIENDIQDLKSGTVQNGELLNQFEERLLIVEKITESVKNEKSKESSAGLIKNGAVFLCNTIQVHSSR